MTGPGVAIEPDRAGPADLGLRVARNTLVLVAGQVVTAALAFGVTALLARHLGAADYGLLVLAAAIAQVAFVVVDLGQEYDLVRAVATRGERPGTLVATALALRVAAGLLALPAIAGGLALLRYPPATRTVVWLTVAFFLLTALAEAVNLAFRGLERMAVETALRVAVKALAAAGVVVAVLAGGGLPAILAAQLAAAVLGLLPCLGVLPRLGPLRVQWSMAGALLAGGSPFLLWNILIAARPTLDVLLLDGLASPDAVGWYGAAWRLVGLLIFPATLLGTALYPTLARLHARDPDGYAGLVAAALRAALMLGTLTAAGTWLFAPAAVDLVYGEGYEPAAGTLKILTGYLALVFPDIVFGAALMAAHLQRPWIVAHVAVLALTAGLDLFLVPGLHAATGNGGLGAAAAVSAAEVVMLATALRFVPLPRARLLGALGRDAGRAAGAAAAMAGAAWLLRDTPAVGPVAAVAAYAAGSVLLGGVRREDLAFLRAVVRLPVR